MRRSRHSLHAATLKSDQSKKIALDVMKRMTAAAPVRRAMPGVPPGVLAIALTTVSEAGSFDAYINVSLRGAAAGAVTPLLFDSGNSVMVYPHFEEIQALPNFATDYNVLGAGSEPWGCPANVIQGPIELTTTAGEIVGIDNAVFYACTADLPNWTPDSGQDQRTANFGAACLNPWGSSGWNTPDGVAAVLQTPLSYLQSHPYAVVQFGAGAVEDAPAGAPHISADSSLALYAVSPPGFNSFAVISNLQWMALAAKSMKIGGVTTGWPGAKQAIAVIDTGGTSAFLSDPDDLVSQAAWPNTLPDNPPWASSSTACHTIADSIAMEVGDARASFTIAIDVGALPAAAQGMTLVMCQVNEYMMGQYGLNTGGISALTNAIMIDHANKQVGFRAI